MDELVDMVELLEGRALWGEGLEPSLVSVRWRVCCRRLLMRLLCCVSLLRKWTRVSDRWYGGARTRSFFLLSQGGRVL